MIRMSTSQMYNNGMSNMLNSYSNLSKVNNQMSSGKRVLTPADDPVAAAQTLNTKTRLAVVQQYNRNTDFADKNLSLTESVLDQTETSLINLKEMAIQLGSDQWSPDQIKASGIEVKEALSHLQGMLNTKNESGEYIFAGSQAENKAYDGNIFKGDAIEREAQVSDDTFIKMLTSGARAFENLKLDELKPVYDPDKRVMDDSIPGNLIPDPLNSGESIPNPEMFIKDEWGDYIPDPDKYIVDPGNPTGNDYVQNPSYTGPFTPLDPAAITTTVQPGFNDGTVVDNSGTSIPFDSTDSDQYSNNMLGVVQYFVDATGNGNPPGEVNKEAIRSGIQNLDVAFEQVAQTRSQIGARQNTLEAIKDSNLDFEAFAKKSISELEDLDYADAFIRLEQSMLSYQAGMQVTGKISGLSLFNYI